MSKTIVSKKNTASTIATFAVLFLIYAILKRAQH